MAILFKKPIKAQHNAKTDPITKIKLNTPSGQKLLDINSDEYRALYESGKLMGYDKATDAYTAAPLNEVVVTAPRKKSLLDQYADKIAKEHKDDGFFEAAVGMPIDAVASIPQLLATKLLSGKVQRPSEALNITNTVGKIATDAILDPVNLVGLNTIKTLNGITFDGVKSSVKEIPSAINSIRANTKNLFKSYNINAVSEDVIHTPGVKKAINTEVNKVKALESLDDNSLVSKIVEEIKSRMKDPEFARRAKASGLKFDNLSKLNVKKITDSWAKSYPEFVGIEGTIGINPSLLDNEDLLKIAMEHEVGHKFANVAKLSMPDNLLGRKKINDQILDLTVKKDLTPQDGTLNNTSSETLFNTSGGFSTKGNDQFSSESLKSSLSNDLNAAKYIKHGTEATGMVYELRRDMLNRNMLSYIYDKITPEMVKQAYNTRQNAAMPLRLFNIIDPSQQNFKKLTKILNTIPALGAPILLNTPNPDNTNLQ
jgi:hypothetical protein